MKRHFQSEFWIGDLVYLVVDQISPQPGIVTSISICPTGITYGVQWQMNSSSHYEIELSREPVRDWSVVVANESEDYP